MAQPIIGGNASNTPIQTSYYILLFSLCLFAYNADAQHTSDPFFNVVRKFIASDYTEDYLKKIEKWSDSSHHAKNVKDGMYQTFLKGKYVSSKKEVIEFTFYTSIFKNIPDIRSTGWIYITNSRNPDSVFHQLLFYKMKFNLDFDTLAIVKDSITRSQKIFLTFDNYRQGTNRVFKQFDSAMIKWLRRDYFDFYFADIDEKTSEWNEDYVYTHEGMAPHSDILVTLIRRNNIQGIIDLINLKNLGFSFTLAEGLWYYNTINPCLTPEQLKIVNTYSHLKGKISFRSKEKLEKSYNFSKADSR